MCRIVYFIYGPEISVLQNVYGLFYIYSVEWKDSILLKHYLLAWYYVLLLNCIIGGGVDWWISGLHVCLCVPRLVHRVPWDRLQAPRDPVYDKRYRKWIDGCIIKGNDLNGLNPDKL